MRKLPGVHVPHRKNTATQPAQRLPIPPEVRIPMAMHIGAPAKVTVSAGDEVKVGQLIGEAAGFVSSPVHSSVSGKVKAIEEQDAATGDKGTFVVIETDGLQTPADGITPPTVTSMEDFIAAARDSGIVGLGGAGFPTAVKLTVKDVSAVEYIIINGAECEPYITSDTRTMIDDAEALWEGVRLIHRFFDARAIYVAVEDNKPEAIKRLGAIAEREPIAQLRPLPSVYPQGGEKVLIYNLTGRIVPEGKLPLDVGCIVINCTTLAALAKYIATGMPLVEKRVTVDGSAVKNPMNLIAPIGTPISALLEHCSVPTEPGKDGVGKILLGGPMMGVAVPDASAPIKKSTNAVTVLNERDARVPEPSACIRCGNCVTHCPLGLMTVDIQSTYLAGKIEFIGVYRPNLCMECGCCTFSCPARRPLTQYMKLAKAALRDYEAAQKAQKEKGGAA
ncbi:MAG: electron transport complex subunit RsxC [Oscillospiraceae bacterium]|jgi:electron transport complex protein RnfC|nr:electron transport complex subunit RsxC [Oscillospiraceae bacterium]